MRTNFRIVLLITALLGVAACGGGGGSTTRSPASPSVGGGGTGGGGSGGGAGNGQTQNQLSFNLDGAVGIVRLNPEDDIVTKAIGDDQPYKKITATGSIEDFITGSVPISDIYIAPDGYLYLLLSSPVEYSTEGQAETRSCILMKVGQENDFECVDDTLTHVYQCDSPPIQFDNAGSVYYVGYSDEGWQNVALRRKTKDGTVEDLINANITLRNFVIDGNGVAYLSGSTTNTGVQWLRKIDAAGVHTFDVDNSYIGWMKKFGDDNIYLQATYNHMNGFWGVMVIDTSTASFRDRCWIADYAFMGYDSNHCNPANGYGYEAPNYSLFDLCTAAGLDLNNECPHWLNSSTFLNTPDGSIYAVLATSGGVEISQLWKLYPTVEYVPFTAVEKMTVVEGLLDYVAIAGLDEADKNKMYLYNLSDGRSVDIFGDAEVEVYHLKFRSDGKIWFDGLRFSDNKYVVGVIDTANGNDVIYLVDTSLKIEDLRMF